MRDVRDAVAFEYQTRTKLIFCFLELVLCNAVTSDGIKKLDSALKDLGLKPQS